MAKKRPNNGQKPTGRPHSRPVGQGPDSDKAPSLPKAVKVAVAVFAVACLTFAGLMSLREASAQGTLTLADFSPPTGQQAVTSALIEAADQGTSSGIITLAPRTPVAGTVLDGSMVIDVDTIGFVARVLPNDDDITINISNSNSVDARDFFGTGGAGEDYSFCFQTTATDQQCIEAADHELAGGSFIRWDWSTADPVQLLVRGIDEDDRFIFSVVEPAPAPTPTPTPDTAPDAPTGLGLTTPNRNAIMASWTAPVNDGGQTVTHYTVDHKLTSAAQWTSANTTDATTNYEITSLLDSTSYDVRVAAVNSVDTGSYSSTQTTTTQAAPTPTPTATPLPDPSGRFIVQSFPDRHPVYSDPNNYLRYLNIEGLTGYETCTADLHAIKNDPDGTPAVANRIGTSLDLFTDFPYQYMEDTPQSRTFVLASVSCTEEGGAAAATPEINRVTVYWGEAADVPVVDLPAFWEKVPGGRLTIMFFIPIGVGLVVASGSRSIPFGSFAFAVVMVILGVLVGLNPMIWIVVLLVAVGVVVGAATVSGRLA